MAETPVNVAYTVYIGITYPASVLPDRQQIEKDVARIRRIIMDSLAEHEALSVSVHPPDVSALPEKTRELRERTC